MEREMSEMKDALGVWSAEVLVLSKEKSKSGLWSTVLSVLQANKMKMYYVLTNLSDL